LTFNEKEIEILKEIQDIHIINDEEEIDISQTLVPKSRLEEEKYIFMVYGGLISATVLIAFLVLMKYKFMANVNATNQQTDSRRKRN